MHNLIIIPTLNSPKIRRFARDFGELDLVSLFSLDHKIGILISYIYIFYTFIVYYMRGVDDTSMSNFAMNS